MKSFEDENGSFVLTAAAVTECISNYMYYISMSKFGILNILIIKINSSSHLLVSKKMSTVGKT